MQDVRGSGARLVVALPIALRFVRLVDAKLTDAKQLVLPIVSLGLVKLPALEHAPLPAKGKDVLLRVVRQVAR